MAKGIRKIQLGEDQIQRLFLDLTKLEPPKKPTLPEVLETYKGSIETAIKRGNSLRDVAKFLTDGGLKVSHETLRKLAAEWGFSKGKPKATPQKSSKETVKNGTEDKAEKQTTKPAILVESSSDKTTASGRFTPRKDLENL